MQKQIVIVARADSQVEIAAGLRKIADELDRVHFGPGTKTSGGIRVLEEGWCESDWEMVIPDPPETQLSLARAALACMEGLITKAESRVDDEAEDLG